MAGKTVAVRHNAEQVAALLDTSEIDSLIRRLEATRWTGRRGYSIRSMVGLCLVKTIYNLPTWTRTVRLVAEHAALTDALGDAPSVDAAYRFTIKLRQHDTALASCIADVLTALRDRMPEFGHDIAVDGSDLPGYANGHRTLRHKDGPARESYSDPDASWGHRSAISTRKGGGYYGFKLHAAVCTVTGLPMAWRVRSAGESEYENVEPVLDQVLARGFAPGTCAMDRGYDGSLVYKACEDRDIHPVIPLRLSVNVVQGKHLPPTCQHGTWTFAGSDAKRGASKWRCPTGACTPASVWIKADRLHTLIPRTTHRWRSLYRNRVMVERCFGELKHEWSMLPLRVRRLPGVQLHVDLTMLTRLACALNTARSLPLAA